MPTKTTNKSQDKPATALLKLADAVGTFAGKISAKTNQITSLAANAIENIKANNSDVQTPGKKGKAAGKKVSASETNWGLAEKKEAATMPASNNKTPAKKTAETKSASKKVAEKNSAVKKIAPKKVAPKKAVAKKATAKKAAPKKAAVIKPNAAKGKSKK